MYHYTELMKYTPSHYVQGYTYSLALQYKGLNRLVDKDGKESYPLRMAKMLEEDERGGEDRFEIFRGMCEAIFRTEDRRRRGLGTQGLVRNKPFVNIMNALA